MRSFFIRLTGNKKQEKFKKENVKKVFIGGGRIGDVMVKTPMLRALGEINENLKIDIVLEKNANSLMKNCPYIDNIQEARPRDKVKIKRILNGLKFALENRKKYDLFFDFTNTPNFFHILTMRVLAPRYLVGCYRAEKYGIKRDELTIFDRYVEVKSGEHAADINMKFLECLGIESQNRKYELFLGEELEEKYKGYFNPQDINIIFNFRGGNERRTLNQGEIEYFIKEIPQIDEKIKLHIMTIPTDYERIKEIVRDIEDERVSLLPKTENILEAAAILKYGDMLVTVDTGIVHVAGAFDIPLVAIFPKDEKAFKLFEPRTSIYRAVMGTKNGMTIEGFSKETVIEYVKEVLKDVKG